MDIEKCRTLLKVLEIGNMTSAAEILGYTPSGISRMIASLENEAGLPLLIRSREGVRPTRECEKLVPVLKEIAYWGSRYEEMTAEFRGLETGTVVVGSVYDAYYPWLSSLIAGFSKEHPGIRFRILDGASSAMAQAIREHRGDFCIASFREGNFRFIRLCDDRPMVLISRNHPEAGRSTFPLRLLETMPYIELYPGIESDKTLLVEKYHVRLDVCYTTQDRFAGYALTEEGLGVCLENEIIARTLTGRLAAIPLEVDSPTEIGILMPPREETSPAAAKFAEYALQRLPSGA